MTPREHLPTARDVQITALARDVADLRVLLDRTAADLDDRLGRLEALAQPDHERTDA